MKTGGTLDNRHDNAVAETFSVTFKSSLSIEEASLFDINVRKARLAYFFVLFCAITTSNKIAATTVSPAAQVKTGP